MDFFTGLEFADFSEACLNLVHENELFFENLNFELVADDYISDLRAYREANDLSTFVLPKVKPDWKDVDEKKKGKFKKIKDTIVEWGKKVIQKIKELIAKAKMLFDDAFKNDNKFLSKVDDCDIMSTSLEGPDPKIFDIDLDANNKEFAGYLNGLANAIKDTAGLLDQKATDTEHAEQRAQAIVAGNYKHLQNAIDELSTDVQMSTYNYDKDKVADSLKKQNKGSYLIIWRYSKGSENYIKNSTAEILKYDTSKEGATEFYRIAMDAMKKMLSLLPMYVNKFVAFCNFRRSWARKILIAIMKREA